jgi:hypothetical protein
MMLRASKQWLLPELVPIFRSPETVQARVPPLTQDKQPLTLWVFRPSTASLDN